MTINELRYATTYELISLARQMIYEGKHTLVKVLIGMLKEKSIQLAMEIEILKSRPSAITNNRILTSKERERNNINEFISKYEHSRKYSRNA